MTNIEKLQALVNRFQVSLPYYKDTKNNYNEHSCRIEYIDPLLKILGWDVANEKGLVPQYREVIAENYSTPTDRPDYTMTLRGVAKFFVEAKKPAVDITRTNDPAFQTRKYGWNANHRIAVLTNFEHLAIYDTCYIPKESDGCTVARYRIFHFTEYIDRFDEILAIISRDAVYSGEFDKYLDDKFPTVGGEKQPVDTLFLAQINEWRVLLSNELYKKGDRYQSLEVLNDVVQEFINQIVFLRICEDKNLPLYHRLQDTISEPAQLQARLEELFRAADHRYNSGMFSGEDIIFDLSSAVISDMIKGLYYPQSPYLFNIIEPNLLGKIYEMFLTEQLELLSNNTIGLGKKRDCLNRSVVTTPTEIVKYMVEKTLSKACSGKSPTDILNLRIADIACGSGIFLEEVFAYLQDYCIQQYIASGEQEHLLEIGNGCYKLTLEEKKRILCSCIYGIDIDIHAVEVAKFSLLIKLIENETDPSVADVLPILPNLSSNILFGNSLVSMEELSGMAVSAEELIELAPFDWNTINGGNQFSVIIGNPPYVNTEDMHTLLPETEVKVYKKKYKTSHKQFDKYFIFIEQAVRKTTEDGYICYIVPNKFFKIGAGEKLRNLIAKNQMLVSLDDFGDAQLFEDKIIYSSILLLCKHRQDTFMYSNIDSANKLWAGEEVSAIELNTSTLNKLPWRLTTDMDFLLMLQKLDRIAVPLTKHAEIFNGIQTSAERPTPIYWFSSYDIVAEFQDAVEICRDGNNYSIEKALLRPYFKPTRQGERGLNSYSILHTDKRIIFPYDEEGHLIPIEKMRTSYPGTYAYLEAYYDRLVPKCVSKSGVRDVPNATEDTWYQYGRTQALTAFINTPKLIVGVLSKEPMYVLDTDDTLIASGGTAGYCAISKKADSPYALEYIQAWLSNPITERILEIVGSDFEGGFTARGTFVLSTLPFVELNFEDNGQKALYDRVIEASREIYDINSTLSARPAKRISVLLQSRKDALIKEIQGLIERVYQLDF
ncbi:restriction endonuclease subunit M [Flavonifractor plautii]|uniref:site-specific DNA-methyltransferase (adenine-specific) n=1 Tax=Flavonifractor plautii TaxID=292800 RepID=A0AAX1KG26_FLAPL|nr:Eco57I restriction-modification methylase domain-containing protein [Flavonifractor plautii]ANU42280.1 restriction endonuclease subunit M [Flavonifractor plautii]OXE48459.1 restriction endonuclease subunit M [Flavonifractor plautii]QQR04827.1 Eco57I restriction-modification methylase domain-containing protein [Flavonifractor plautii]UQA25625.1 Eco57I restriction-modification methylase domain-containing protein [Flavonifractor plautii]